MTIKDLKEAIQNLDDNIEIGYQTSTYLSKDILDLITLNTVCQYNDKDNVFILADISKNYVTPKDLRDNNLILMKKEDEVCNDDMA